MEVERTTPLSSRRKQPAFQRKNKQPAKKRRLSQKIPVLPLAISDAKYVDTALATYAFDTTGSITHLSIIPTGDLVGTRDGQSCRLTSLQIRGLGKANSATDIAQGVFYIIWDAMPNKALPAITDIFTAANSTAFTNRENNGRFTILKKRFFDFTAPVGGSAGDTTKQQTVDHWMKLPPGCVIQCTAADTTGVIGNRIKGALYLVTMGSQAAGTAAAECSLKFRLGFSDK